MTLQKQVSKTHYDFNQYVDRERWISFSHQIGEIIQADPVSILEIGVGTGITQYVLKDIMHFDYETMDIDEELHPDHTGSVLDMPFADKQYDVIGCFQVLEHLPFDNFEKALSELFRVAKKAVILSLPNDERVTHIHIPKIMDKKLIKTPFIRMKQHVFNGEHYWEINRKGYEINKIIKIIKNVGNTFNFFLEKEYRIFEHPYHHFFVLKKQ